MRTSIFSRRFFLRLLAGPALYYAAGRPERARSRDTADELVAIADLLIPRDSARVVGRAFLRRFPEESSVESLVAAIDRGRSEDSLTPTRASGERLAQSLAQQIRDDFATGHTLVVEEWVLSATEVRLCALVSIA
jgi:hypothetical protein